MIEIFLSYARHDGKAAATKLLNELVRVGYKVWRDIEDMQGGQAWKEQLRQAIKTVDVVLVLMTPAAVASKYVEWEWETGLTLEKKVIPLLMVSCNVPGDLGRLHYHNLSTEREYVLGFASLIRDLNQAHSTNADSDMLLPKSSKTKPNGTGSNNISITGSTNSSNVVTGSSNIVGNNNTVS